MTDNKSDNKPDNQPDNKPDNKPNNKHNNKPNNKNNNNGNTTSDIDTGADKARSESLWPADFAGGDNAAKSASNTAPNADGGKADDGRFSVAEEVSLDQQFDSARHVGQAPADPATVEALADTIKPAPEGQGDNRA